MKERLLGLEARVRLRRFKVIGYVLLFVEWVELMIVLNGLTFSPKYAVTESASVDPFIIVPSSSKTLKVALIYYPLIICNKMFCFDML